MTGGQGMTSPFLARCWRREPDECDAFSTGLKPIGNDDRRRGGRRLGRDNNNDPFAEALDQLQSHLQNCVSDDDDLAQAHELLSRLLEAMPKGSEEDDSEDSEASNDPEAQRRDPDHFQGQGRRSEDDGYPSDPQQKPEGQDRRRQRRRMAGDQRPQEGILARILAAKTR